MMGTHDENPEFLQFYYQNGDIKLQPNTIFYNTVNKIIIYKSILIYISENENVFLIWNNN